MSLHKQINPSERMEKLLKAVQIVEGWQNEDQPEEIGKLRDELPADSPFRRFAEDLAALTAQSQELLKLYPLLENLDFDSFYNWSGNPQKSQLVCDRRGGEDEETSTHRTPSERFFHPRREKVVGYIRLIDKTRKIQEALRDHGKEETSEEEVEAETVQAAS